MIAIEILARENAKREKYLKQKRRADRKADMKARNIEVVGYEYLGSPIMPPHGGEPRY